jgi:hypothetical protein
MFMLESERVSPRVFHGAAAVLLYCCRVVGKGLVVGLLVLCRGLCGCVGRHQ